MKTILKKSGAIFLSLIFIISLTFVPTKAATYVANWGQREVDCTSLSSYAIAYYTGSYSIANLAANAGGTSQSNAPSSTLYSALKSMMTNKHSKQTSYQETRNMYKYTDCQNGDISTISSFYSGTSLSGTWGTGWNREHTWPNSKGLGGNDENDIMMLRPTATSENSSRGNKAYGKTNGQYIYNPNSESNGKYDLRGDVARICLYTYTRWGNTSKMWGYGNSSGVIESLSTLIEWMTVDPVDTWEMGRNDAVQSITGVRNVFVDYPELAFKLFGYAVPANYTSPSGLGNSIGGSGNVTPPTTSTPATSSKPTNVLDQVMGNNSNSNNNSSKVDVNVNANQNATIDQSGNKVDTSKDYDVDIDDCRHEVTVHKNEIPATCESAGMTAELLCDQCGLYISPGKEIPKLTHKPSADGVTCEYCGKDFTKVEIDFDNDFVLDTLTIWLIVGSSAAVLVIAGVVITIVVIKKKKNKV